MNKKFITLPICIILVIVLVIILAPKTANENIESGLTKDLTENVSEKSAPEKIIIAAESPKTPFKISFDLPAGWTYSVLQANDQYHTLAVGLYPEKENGNTEYIYIQYSKGFTTYGTVVKEEDIEINGMKASRGFYNGSNVWDYISFKDDFKDCAIINSAKAWNDKYEADINTIFNSLEFIPVS